MAAPESAWWVPVVEHVLSGIGFVVAGVSGLLYRNYRNHIAMLRKHDEALVEAETERGLQRAHRELANKGPIGEKLVEVIKELEATDRRLHKRITKRRDEHDALKTELADKLGRIETKLDFLCGEKNQSE